MTPTGDPVLAARFAVPSVPTTFVRRPRLVKLLSDGEGCPLILVNGPAGAGKTLLVADWTGSAAMPGPVVWLTLERGDDMPGTFWAYVLAALRRSAGSLPDGVGTPARADEVDPSLLARLAAHLSNRDEPVLLVLDEFERVASTEIASQLHFVLRHSAPGLRLVLISRSEPLLPLHRYRAAGEITDIRNGDLAFTPPETAALLSRHGLSLPADDARALTERTRGWAAGLRLTALATQGAADPEGFLAEFEASRSTVADFLLAEVLDVQPAETQDLLLRTSILEQTHPDLADALTGRQDADGILARLQHANAFVEPIGHSWYRHHPLFAEILRVQLRARHPGLEPELHRRAARWLGEAGRLADALPHAVEGDDWAFATTRFVDDLAIGRLFTGLDSNHFAELFSGMGPEAAGPAADIVRAARDLARNDTDNGLNHLQRAEEGLLDDGPADASAARLSCAFLRVIAGRLIGSADMAQTAAQAAEDLARTIPERLLGDHPELTALLQTDLGSALLWEGRFETARTALTAAAEAPDSPATAFPRHESLSRLALIELLRGWIGRAEAHAHRALAEAERCGLPPSSCTGVGQLVLAEVAVDRDDLPAARTALQCAAESSAARHDPIVANGLVIVRSRLFLAARDPEAALTALADAGGLTSASAPSPWVADRVALAASAAHLAAGDPEAAVEALEDRVSSGPERAVGLARVHLASGDGERALEVLDSVHGESGSGPGTAVPVLLARSQAAVLLGDDASAARLLGRALATARPEHLRRPFCDAGPWLRRLLRNRPVLARAHDWLPAGLLAGLPRPDTVRDGAVLLVEPLSEREREVLDRAAQMMSTEEIAADLHLSVNTVKTHLKSINRKLSATRRGEAVRRAKELHLL
ncbi:LuxR C-terminal-related transcriptional regulator [Streptomyces kaniharaensis]|uniref:LuxR C-terminal-related transcriptional regulator n=1 Tax=Streptomyces kaniharaensis TaxID=212423 RepID=UPI002DDCBC27|nr:LuxR C-terminal-related transcriptional regulator [Streptomyces kaniharaensis]